MPFFHPAEFECQCKCGRSEMVPAFVADLEALRTAYGKPLIVSSGYRCPAHNARVSSTGLDGPHTTGRAVDFAIRGADAYQLMSLAIRMGFTGVGVNQKGGGRFLHLDKLPGGASQPRPMVWSY